MYDTTYLAAEMGDWDSEELDILCLFLVRNVHSTEVFSTQAADRTYPYIQVQHTETLFPE